MLDRAQECCGIAPSFSSSSRLGAVGVGLVACTAYVASLVQMGKSLLVEGGGGLSVYKCHAACRVSTHRFFSGSIRVGIYSHMGLEFLRTEAFLFLHTEPEARDSLPCLPSSAC